MRNISPLSLTKIAQRTGGEPVIFVQLYWAPGFPPLVYGDKELYGQFSGRILEIADLESVTDISNSSSSTSLRIKLDDTDGLLKSTFDNNDIHGATVQVYQWFSDIPLSDAFLIFEGETASPIEWAEGDRTLSFDVLSKLHDVEVGFSVEEGDFLNVPQSVINKAWPIIFGTVIHMPTVPMDEIPTGTLLQDIGIPDYGINQHLNYIDSKTAEQMAKAACYSRVGAHLKFLANTAGGNNPQMFLQGEALQRQAQNIYRGIIQQMSRDKTRLTKIQTQQRSFDTNSFSILNGEFFLQGQQVELKIKDAYYTGSFSGNIFNVTSRRGPDDPYHRTPGLWKPAPGVTIDIPIEDTQEYDDQQFAELLFSGPADPQSHDVPGFPQSGDPCSPPNFIWVPNTPPQGIFPGEKHNFFFAPAGTTVRPGQNYPLRHIVSIIPGTVILDVGAKRTVGGPTAGANGIVDNPGTLGIRQIDSVPQQYWYTEVVQYGPITATILVLTEPLSSILDQDWEDQIYVTAVSPVGPNVVDVLIWLIQQYTPYAIDLESFDRVRDQCANYPVNFAVMDRPNIVDLLKTICYQARCAIWLKNQTFYVKYLPAEDTPVDSITEDDVILSSLVVSTTPTEDLVTKVTATWKDDLAYDNKFVVARYNIGKYGLKRADENYLIYNYYPLVEKSVVFWLIRKSNSWKILKCKVAISKLKLETLDTVTVNFTKPWVANTPVNGIVQACKFNSHDYTIDLEIWCPVLLGEMVANPWAYPATADVEVVFPLMKQEAGNFNNHTLNELAEGDLSRNSINVTFFPMGKGKQPIPISDAVDGFPPPVLGTTILGFNIAGASPTAQQAKKGGDYTLRKYDTPQPAQINIAGVPTAVQIMDNLGIAEGIPDGRFDLVYSAAFYGNGPDNDSTSNGVVYQIRAKDSESAIDSGTFCLAIPLSWNDSEGNPQTYFYVQSPLSSSTNVVVEIDSKDGAISEIPGAVGYFVNVYKKGIETGAEFETGYAVQIQQDIDDELPADALFIGYGVPHTNSDGSVDTWYYIGAPVWLDDA